MFNGRLLEAVALLLVAFFVLQSCGTEAADTPVSDTSNSMESSVVVSQATTASSAVGMPSTPTSQAGREMSDESSPSSSSTSITAAHESEYTPVAMERRPVSYLEEIIPPCLPVDESGQDGCSQGGPGVVESASTSGGMLIWAVDGIPTIEGVLLGRTGPGTEVHPVRIPHIAIRGTVQAGTTRCELYRYKHLSFIDPLFTGFRYYYCFADISVHEYIVGEGPDKLTVAMHREIVWLYRDEFADWLNIRDEYVMDVLNDPQSRTAAVYEGKEMILLLDIPSTIAVESWTRSGSWGTVWFLRRDETGDIRALEQDIELALIHQQIDPDLPLSEFDLPLSELVARIKKAADNRMTATEGRIGIDSSLPLLVTDANRLQDFYGAVGAVYEGDDATVLPPPVPGGDEPEQDPTQTGVEEPDPAPPAPGEEETPPPPADDSAATSTSTTLQPQAEDTTTSSTTSTTTTTQPQTEDTTPTAAETTLPQSGDDIPTPTETTLPPDNSGNTAPAVDEGTGAGTG